VVFSRCLRLSAFPSALARVPALALALALVTNAAPARADGKSAAQLYEEGLKLTRSGDARSALASFRASYDKDPRPKVLYSIGQACARVGDGACAVRAYEQYLREGGKEVTAKRRKAVEAEVHAISQTLGTIVVKSNVTGAEVSVDGVAVGKTPISAPVPANGGSHKVVLVAPAAAGAGAAVGATARTAETTVNVVAGESATAQLDVKEEAPLPAPHAAPPPAPSDAPALSESKAEPVLATPAPRESRPFPLVPWVVTGGLAVGTAITGILAAGAYSSFKDTKATYPISRSELDSAQGSARDLFVVTAILGAGTVISASIASYLTFAPADAPDKKLHVGVGPRGVTLAGAFQ
jgi:hypothetical protein